MPPKPSVVPTFPFASHTGHRNICAARTGDGSTSASAISYAAGQGFDVRSSPPKDTLDGRKMVYQVPGGALLLWIGVDLIRRVAHLSPEPRIFKYDRPADANPDISPRKEIRRVWTREHTFPALQSPLRGTALRPPRPKGRQMLLVCLRFYG